MEELIKQLVQTNALQQEQIALLRETLLKSPGREEEGISAMVNPRAAVQRSLQKMTSKDEIEAYLTVFERTAEREKLPKAEWVEVLAPYLTAGPQKAYHDLSNHEVNDYAKLKAEILACLGVTAAV